MTGRQKVKFHLFRKLFALSEVQIRKQQFPGLLFGSRLNIMTLLKNVQRALRQIIKSHDALGLLPQY